MNRIVGAAALAALVVAASAGLAGAQQRTFYCGEQTSITVTINRSTITAGPIDGQTFQMQPVPGRQWTFYKDDYELTMAPDQNSIQVSIPDFGDVQCAYQGGTAAAEPPPPPDFSNDGADDFSDDQGGDDFASGQGQGDDGQSGNADLPAQAKSWGGSVRAGPGIGFQKIGSLPEGEPIVIVEQADAPFYQDRPWFKITFRGRTGYQWGGIICPLGAPVPGTFQVC